MTMIVEDVELDIITEINNILKDSISNLSKSNIELIIEVLDVVTIDDQVTVQISFHAVSDEHSESEVKSIVLDELNNSKLHSLINISEINISEDTINNIIVGEFLGPIIDNSLDESVSLIESTVFIHNQLNPKLFKNNKLIPEVRSKLFNIVSEFKDYIEFPLDIIDVYLLGSNVGYNYTDTSDLDVHIITNYDTMDISEDILQTIYNCKKSSFNSDYDIEIKGIPVELYVEDMKAHAISNGIYSLYSDTWIMEPQKIKIPNIDIDSQLNYWKTRVNSVLHSDNFQEVKLLIDRLYLLRKSSLMTEGEYGEGNLIFKHLRSEGLISKLFDKLYELKSDSLSLESYYRGV